MSTRPDGTERDANSEVAILLKSIVMRDLLDEIGGDDDIPPYRRNQARQAVHDFDRVMPQ